MRAGVLTPGGGAAGSNPADLVDGGESRPSEVTTAEAAIGVPAPATWADPDLVLAPDDKRSLWALGA